ncbi:conserved hypothetical protein [Theileria orientalis strain Shintoku]|uniref:Uncharacterized protein n=1 Tax=Theileria orientalis strain Shintoku TaxID=869250 RepID=J4DQ78_THEOR|nr:conserved hypothetical protein [Theileria orientalis strain Shintoku]BAM41979.1 conserved hypothetical protein [Theileria orientalis strain Shintoku]|eukprot:XP_009692280.1 conserved hypothetical protein [Theileria orientalis strain Shintoku]
MSAALIWKRCRLDDELNKLRKYDMSDADTFVCNDAKNVINLSNCFKNDLYSLPPGFDSKLKELYPLLQQVHYESANLTDYELERMAERIKFSETTHYEDLGTGRFDSSEDPFNHTYFPDYVLPSNQNNLFDKSYEKPSDFEYKTPASIYRTNMRNGSGHDSGCGMSVDRSASYGNLFPSNNLFSSSTYKSQYNTPGYYNSSYNVNSSKFLETPANMKYKQVRDTVYGHKNTYNNESVDSNRGFDYKNEFLTAFQPGNEYKNDYTTVETPMVDMSRANNNDDFVASFPWERELNEQFITNANQNENYYDSLYANSNFQSNDGLSTKRDYLFSDGKSFANFSPNSPLRSFMNDDVNYKYHIEPTPRRPYY